MIIRVIEKWLNLSRWHEDFRESSFVFIALSFLTAIFSFFLYYNIFIVPFPPMILLDGLGVLGCLVGFYFLKGNRRFPFGGHHCGGCDDGDQLALYR